MPQSSPETRASLILRLRNADDLAAWDEFTGLYGPVVYRVARKRGLQAADAENLVQEVLLAVAQSVSRWIERDNRGSFHAWLLRIAHNEVVDTLTRPSTRSLGQDGERGQKLLDAVSVHGDISSMIEHECERELFRWAADRVQQTVAPQTWQAFWLTEVNGQTVRQAAETIGTTSGQIYVNRSRVMARIKELVNEREARK